MHPEHVQHPLQFPQLTLSVQAELLVHVLHPDTLQSLHSVHELRAVQFRQRKQASQLVFVSSVE